jgi:lysozyme
VKLSNEGLDAIKRHEGLRLNAYPDPGSKDGKPVTIGYGSTRRMDGSPWNLGDTITEPEAAELLRRDLSHAEATVINAVKVPIEQQQFDALVSLAYNIGATAFKNSTLVKKLNAGDYDGAADQFAVWRLNDGKVMQGLVDRRAAEAELFRTAITQPAEQPPAPIVESKPVYVREEKPMSPFIAAALPELVKQIPALIRVFGDGRVTERNAEAAERVVEIVKAATNADNAQSAIEAVVNDTQAKVVATEALRREGWFEATEAGGEGIAGARDFNLKAAEVAVWKQPAMVVTILLLPLAYMVVGAVLFSDGYSPEMQALVVGAIMSGVLAAVTAFWLGTVIRNNNQQG